MQLLAKAVKQGLQDLQKCPVLQAMLEFKIDPVTVRAHVAQTFEYWLSQASNQFNQAVASQSARVDSIIGKKDAELTSQKVENSRLDYLLSQLRTKSVQVENQLLAKKEQLSRAQGQLKMAEGVRKAQQQSRQHLEQNNARMLREYQLMATSLAQLQNYCLNQQRANQYLRRSQFQLELALQRKSKELISLAERMQYQQKKSGEARQDLDLFHENHKNQIGDREKRIKELQGVLEQVQNQKTQMLKQYQKLKSSIEQQKTKIYKAEAQAATKLEEELKGLREKNTVLEIRQKEFMESKTRQECQEKEHGGQSGNRRDESTQRQIEQLRRRLKQEEEKRLAAEQKTQVMRKETAEQLKKENKSKLQMSGMTKRDQSQLSQMIINRYKLLESKLKQQQSLIEILKGEIENKSKSNESVLFKRMEELVEGLRQEKESGKDLRDRVEELMHENTDIRMENIDLKTNLKILESKVAKSQLHEIVEKNEQSENKGASVSIMQERLEQTNARMEEYRAENREMKGELKRVREELELARLRLAQTEEEAAVVLEREQCLKQKLGKEIEDSKKLVGKFDQLNIQYSKLVQFSRNLMAVQQQEANTRSAVSQFCEIRGRVASLLQKVRLEVLRLQEKVVNQVSYMRTELATSLDCIVRKVSLYGETSKSRQKDQIGQLVKQQERQLLAFHQAFVLQLRDRERQILDDCGIKLRELETELVNYQRAADYLKQANGTIRKQNQALRLERAKLMSESQKRRGRQTISQVQAEGLELDRQLDQMLRRLRN